MQEILKVKILASERRNESNTLKLCQKGRLYSIEKPFHFLPNLLNLILMAIMVAGPTYFDSVGLQVMQTFKKNNRIYLLYVNS